MRNPAHKALLLAGAIAMTSLLGSACGDDDSDAPPTLKVGHVVAYTGKGVLADLEAPYGTLSLLRIQGTHYEMGYQYGYLLHDRIWSIWNTVFGPLVTEELGVDPELAIDMFNSLMDSAWGHVEPYTSQDVLDELEGARQGAEDAGDADPDGLVDILRRVMMLVDTSQANDVGADVGTMTRFFSRGYSQGFADYFSNTTGGLEDLELRDQRLAMDGRYAPSTLLSRLASRITAPACSFFAVWGDWTEDGRQIGSRVLDFDADIGLGDYGLITVFVPDGASAYVTVGYVGMMSTLAGMSERGLALAAVGSESSLDRLETESISLKGRAVLELAEGLDDGLAMLTGSADDGAVHAPSVGTVAGILYGDPEGGGAGAEAVASEFNGVFASAYRHGPAPACAESASLFEFDFEGRLAATYNHDTDPDMANLEEEAYEIDKSGNIRTFLVDANQEFVYDATTGELIDDPNGEPFPVGYVLPCAVYRADPALNLVVRRYQTASNGPARDSDNILMHTAGAYRNRYKPHYDALLALRQGTRFEWEGEEIFPDNGGAARKVGVGEAKAILRVVAMDHANTFAVIYDTTNLVLYVAYESGTGETWRRAVDNEYLELRLADLLPERR